MLAGDLENETASSLCAPQTETSIKTIEDFQDASRSVVLRPTEAVFRETSSTLKAAGYGESQTMISPALLSVGTPEGEGVDQLTDAAQDQLLSVLQSLDEVADSFDQNAALTTEIPLLGSSLNGLLGSDAVADPQRWGDFLRIESSVGEYFGAFDPTSEFFDADNAGMSPTASGLSAFIAQRLDIGSELGLSVGDNTLTIGVVESLIDDELKFDLSVTGSVNNEAPFDLDSLNADWDALGLSLSAAGNIDFTTTIDLDVEFGLRGFSDPTAAEAFFDFQQLQVSAAIDASSSAVNYGLGPIDGTIDATTLMAGATATVTFDEGAAPLSQRVNLAATTGFDLSLVLQGAYGDKNPSVSWSDTNLLDGINAPQIDAAALINSVSAEPLINGLLDLADYLNEAIQPDDSAGGDSIANTKIPLLNQTFGELISAPADLRSLSPSSLSGITIDGGMKRFTAEFAGSVAAQGIKLGDTVRFLTASGERFPAIVDGISGNSVTLAYDAARTDEPAATSDLQFEIGGSLGDQIKAALAGFGSRIQAGDLSAPSFGEVLDVLAETMGFLPGDIDYDPATEILSFTPDFTPVALQYETKLDLSEQIPGLEFEASGDFLVTATPTIRLPLGIDLTDNTVFLIDDAQPEVSISLSAQLDDPRASAALGFLGVVLSEDASVTPNNGIGFSTDLTLDVGSANDGSQVTFGDIASDVTGSFVGLANGSFNIDGVEITPNVAGTTIPGRVEIYTTSDGSARGAATFANFNDLKTLFDNIEIDNIEIGNIEIDNTIGEFDELTPEDIVSMFIELGQSIGTISETLDVPGGIPFVEEAISNVANFAEVTTGFARNLYFHPKVVAADEVSVTNGKLTSDTSFIVNIEGGQPVAVTVTQSATEDNSSIDDLVVDINNAINQTDLSGSVVAERQSPLGATEIETVTFSGTEYTFNLVADSNLFERGIKPGHDVEYLDVNGDYQNAVAIAVTPTSLTIDVGASVAAESGAQRSLALFDRADANKIALRTSGEITGLTLGVSTVQVTGDQDLPAQLGEDITLTIDLDGTSVDVVVTPADTEASLRPADLVEVLNAKFAETNFDNQGELDAFVRAVLVDDKLRISVVDFGVQEISVTGASALGLADGQMADENTARSEIGFSSGQFSEAQFRANTIADLVHVLNDIVGQQFAGSSVSTDLAYQDNGTPGIADDDFITFNLLLGETFTQSIDLDFSEGLDVGFAELNVAGGADATVSVAAGLQLGVGIDLSPPGSDITVDAATPLSSLDGGNGTVLKVGVLGTTIPSSGTIAGDVTLAFDVSKFDVAGATSVSITIDSADDNTSLIDLASELTEALRAEFETNTALGLPIVDDIVPIEVQVDDGKLVLIANDVSINGLQIAAATTPQLGFASGQLSDLPDLLVTLRDGSDFTVNLDRTNNLGDVLETLQDATSEQLSVTFEGDQIILTDNSGGTSAPLSVKVYSDAFGPSGAGSSLGILQSVPVREDDPGTSEDESANNNVLRGFPLFTGSRLDQFFIDTDSNNTKVFANASIVADDIDLVASLSLLDLGIRDGSAAFSAEASVELEDVDGDNKLRLSDLTGDGFPTLVPTFEYGGNVTLPIDGSLLGFLPDEFKPGPNGEDPASPLEVLVTLANDAGSLRPNLNYSVDNLEEAVSSFKNLSLEDMARIVQQVVDMLQNSDIDGLNSTIPVINKTPNDVLGIVDSLAAAAEDLLAGPDVDALRAQIAELEDIVDGLGGTPDQRADVDDLVRSLKANVDQDHVLTLSFGADETAEISQQSSAMELKDAFDAALGAGVIQDVSGQRGGPFIVTFTNDPGSAMLEARSRTGLNVQSRTLAPENGMVRQELTFITTGKLVASIRALGDAVEAIDELSNGEPTPGRANAIAKVAELSDSIASTNSLGKIIGDAIKDGLGLSDDAFQLHLDFVDADDATTGFQPAARVFLDIQKSVTETVSLDFNLPDLGPVDVSSDVNVDFSVGGEVNLDFGFRFDTFEAYLLDSTSFNLSAGIDSGISAGAGIGGLRADIDGVLKLENNAGDGDASINVGFANPQTTIEDQNFVGVTFGGLSPQSDFNFNLDGAVSANLDANVAGFNIEDAITVSFDLSDPSSLSYSFDGISNYLSNASLSDLSLTQILSGGKALIDLLETGLKSDLLEQMPLIGDGVDLTGSFTGKLRSMFDALDVINSPDGDIGGLGESIKQTIFGVLGPQGANLLPTIDAIQITLPDPNLPASQLEFKVMLSVAGSDSIDVPFDFGLDALAFDFEANGGLELGAQLRIRFRIRSQS